MRLKGSIPPKPNLRVLWICGERSRSSPKRQARAVVLHYLIDLPVAQVAEVMGCREGTAKAHLDRGRRTLARLLEPSEARQEDG
jgi:DNA-directed RNA polymerase specialized sigma24 family protein